MANHFWRPIIKRVILSENKKQKPLFRFQKFQLNFRKNYEIRQYEKERATVLAIDGIQKYNPEVYYQQQNF